LLLTREAALVTTNVLFLCTHNSARSVLAEGMLNHWARALDQDVRAHSAGSAPSGHINPIALEVLADAGIDTDGYRSKSWDEFTVPQAPRMRVVITMCDSAAAEPCPWWPGTPVTVHWGHPDPSDAPTSEKKHVFDMTRRAIGYRVLQFLRLPVERMDDAALQLALATISKA
jgi:arsenate reductase (thioredoxin)